MLPMKPLSLLLIGALLVLLVLLTITAWAQTDRPIPITPGVPLRELTATSPAPGGCFEPLNFEVGQVAFIEAGVNIRNQPSQSSALLWNTIYNNRDEEGRVRDPALAVPVIIEDGPVCAQGYNWWFVDNVEGVELERGWVAEGRPDESGYWLFAPGVAAGPEACTTRFDLAVGETAALQFNTRIREAPSLDARTETIVPFETPIFIAGGPRCEEGILWWFVRATVVGAMYEGWMAEARFGDDYVVPEDLPNTDDGTLCARPLPFFPGLLAEVFYTSGQPKALRAAPDEQAPLLFTLVRHVPLVIEGGPVCADNLNWWQVRVQASDPIIGWMAEGSPFAGYWIQERGDERYPTRP